MRYEETRVNNQKVSKFKFAFFSETGRKMKLTTFITVFTM